RPGRARCLRDSIRKNARHHLRSGLAPGGAKPAGGRCLPAPPARDRRPRDPAKTWIHPPPMNGEGWPIIWFTLLLASVATLLVTPVGIAIGWLLARKNWPGKLFVETVLYLPLVLPPVATGLLLLKAFGRRGPLGGFLEEHLGLEIVFTWRAVLLALAVMSFPLLVRTMRVAFEEVNPRL